MKREHGQEEGQGQGKAARLTRGQMAMALRIGSDAAVDRDGPAPQDPDGAHEPPPAGVGRAGAGITVAMLVAGTLAIQTVTGIPAVRTNSGDGPPSAGAGRGSIPRAGGGTGAIQDNESRQEQQKMFGKLTGVAAATAVGVSTTIAGAQATAVQWRVEDGGNGHWYQICDWGHISWTEALTSAQSRGSHLATLTSAQESNFVGALLTTNRAIILGGFQDRSAPDYAEPMGGWRWVTGEPWTYTNWIQGEPNNSGDVEDYLGFGRTQQYADQWNDGGNFCQPCEPSYVAIEFDADCNNDGIVDYGQCQDGTLPDYNGNNVPDCCERGEACVVGNYPVQWKVSESGNGHWYRFVVASVKWTTAQTESSADGGYLITLHTAIEAQFVRTLGMEVCWIGLKQNTADPDFSEPAGGWNWVTSEALIYSNWRVNTNGQPNEPNDGIGAGGENWALLDAGAVTWNDVRDDPIASYCIEWSADCNNDGIVDYGQILQGQLADLDANGIPDICQQPTCVDVDLFRDFNVNGADLGILLSQWGPINPLTVADINADGAVNGADLGLLLAAWGPCND